MNEFGWYNLGIHAWVNLEMDAWVNINLSVFAWRLNLPESSMSAAWEWVKSKPVSKPCVEWILYSDIRKPLLNGVIAETGEHKYLTYSTYHITQLSWFT